MQPFQILICKTISFLTNSEANWPLFRFPLLLDTLMHLIIDSHVQLLHKFHQKRIKKFEFALKILKV